MLKLTRPRGRRYWYLRGTVRGISVFESTKTDRREAAEAIRVHREAELLERSVHGAAATATFLEAAVMYMEAGGEGRYVGPLIEHFRGVKLAAIDQAAIDRAGRTIKPHAASATLNRQVHTPIAAVLNFAAQRGLCEVRRVKRPKQPRGRVRYLTPAEAETLINACGPHLRPLVIFLLYTGARVSEAVHLDWREVDLSRRHVAFLDTKNGEPRGVPLHPRAFEALANLPHRDGAVFRYAGRKIKPKQRAAQAYRRRRYGGGQIRTAFAAACRRAGLSNLHPHDLRHTWATWHYAANRDLGQLMELGGWKSEAMVMRYAHVNSDHLRASIDRLPGGAESVQSGQGKRA